MSLFAGARLEWRWPPRAPAMIFDAAGKDVLEDCLPPHCAVLHIRGERINVPVAIASLFRTGGRFDAYIDGYIARTRPRLVVTLIDNNSRFYSLASRHPDIAFMFVQGSLRGPELFLELGRARNSGMELKIHRMLTFGGGIAAEYAKYVHGMAIVVGSPFNNAIPRSRKTTPGTIAFVSQFRDIPGMVYGGRYRDRRELYEETDKMILEFLLAYARRHHKQLLIVPSLDAARNPELRRREEAYYNDLLETRFEFSEWHWRGSSYDVVDGAEVVVGIDSTLVYESAARGNKTAIFSVRSAMLDLPGRTYGWPAALPDDGPYWTNRPDPIAFERIMDHLFSIDEEQWARELAESGFAAVLAYDPGNSRLRAAIAEVLGPRSRQDDASRATLIN